MHNYTDVLIEDILQSGDSRLGAEGLEFNLAAVANKEYRNILSGISGIYLLTNLVNGHMYVGQAKNLAERLQRHKIRGEAWGKPSIIYRDSPALHAAINKYGAQNFLVKILECTNDLDTAERHWIAYYNTFSDPKHYNLTQGGQNARTHGRKIKQLSKDGRVIHVYDSIADAAADLKTTGYIGQARSRNAGKLVYPPDIETVRKTINDAIQGTGGRATPYGYRWEAII